MAQEIKKLRGMNPAELEAEEQAIREEIWKLRLQRATGQLQDSRKVREARHDLARVLTIRTELAAAAAGGKRQ